MHDLVPLLAAGAALGVLHSFEPDHLAAMAVMIGGRRGRRFADFANGALWGAGHTVALGAFGAALIVLEMQSSGILERLLEAGVALMLVALGTLRWNGASRWLHGHRHRHGETEHEHFHLHLGRSHGAREHSNHSHLPFWIGMLHGLAGTGAVLVLAPALIVASPQSYLFYVLAFGIGSMLSMGAYCGGLGSLITRLQARFSGTLYRFTRATGVLCIGLGLAWLWRAVLP